MDNAKIVKNILRHIEKIFKYTNDVDYNHFLNDIVLQDACLLNLSQIGENIVGLDDAFIENHKEIKWKEMKGMRNIIVHDYDGVNMRIVWDTIKCDLPVLKQQFENLL